MCGVNGSIRRAPDTRDNLHVAFSLGSVGGGRHAGVVHEDREGCLRAMQSKAVLSKDGRFDGWFFTAVLTTGIYCRASCPVPPPKPENTRFYPTAAAAQQAGFRACKRCRPDASPLAIARAQRAQTARLLVETTALPMGDVAFAAGFASIRSFNDTVRDVFALTPTELRRRAVNGATGGSTLSLRLPFRAPLCPDNLFGHLSATTVPGVEEWRDGAYRRTLRLPNGHGIVTLRPLPDHISCQLALTDLRDLAIAISRCRRMLDLDA